MFCDVIYKQEFCAILTPYFTDYDTDYTQLEIEQTIILNKMILPILIVRGSDLTII